MKIAAEHPRPQPEFDARQYPQRSGTNCFPRNEPSKLLKAEGLGVQVPGPEPPKPTSRHPKKCYFAKAPKRLAKLCLTPCYY
jgi:hypothetical protein